MNTPSSEFTRVIDSESVIVVPTDIEGLTDDIASLKGIYDPVIRNKFHRLSPEDKVAGTKIINRVLKSFDAKWGIRWLDEYGEDLNRNWMTQPLSKFPDLVREMIEKYVSQKEMYLIRCLNQSVLHMCRQGNYTTCPPDDFMLELPDSSRMANWNEYSPDNQLDLASRSLENAHIRDVQEIQIISENKWRARWARAVGQVYHAHRLYTQIRKAATRIAIRQRLDVEPVTRSSVLRKSISLESASALDAARSQIAADAAKVAEDSANAAMMEHLGCNLEGAYLLSVFRILICEF